MKLATLLEQALQDGLAQFTQGENVGALLVHRRGRVLAVADLGEQKLETVFLLEEGFAHSAPIFDGCWLGLRHAGL